MDAPQPLLEPRYNSNERDLMVVIAWTKPNNAIERSFRFGAGGTKIILGLLLVVQGARTFWRIQTTINPVELEKASHLVNSGVFSYSRNPIYIGFASVLAG